MTQPGEIWIGETVGTLVLMDPYGRTYSDGELQGERSERTVDSTLRTDILWRKKRFSLAYDIITGTALDLYQTLYDLGVNLVMRLRYTAALEKTYTVKMLPFERTRLALIGDGLWEGVTFEFEEV
jgi:hypothetical protein